MNMKDELVKRQIELGILEALLTIKKCMVYFTVLSIVSLACSALAMLLLFAL